MARCNRPGGRVDRCDEVLDIAEVALQESIGAADLPWTARPAAVQHSRDSLMSLDLDKRSHYRGHVLSCHPELQDDGRFQARVAITCLGADATPSQRFLDLDYCSTRQQAIERARLAGVAWVDREWSSRDIKPGMSLPLIAGRGAMA